MSSFIKRKREEAGLTQSELSERMGVSVVSVQNWESGRTKLDQRNYTKLSEVLNIPVDQIIKEVLIEADDESKNLDNWPAFLFDDDINGIIDTLHLNMAQQDLFGLLYIYDSEYLKWETNSIDTFDNDLKKVPFGFIDKVGSIQFMNQAEGLHKVIRYVKTDFLLKILKLNSYAEFNVKRLPKEFICEYIDNGYRSGIGSASESAGYEEREEWFHFAISMRKAKIMLPILKEFGPVHVTDGWWANPIRDDIPEAVFEGILSMCNFVGALWKKGYYKNYYNTTYVMGGLESVTDFYEDKEKKWIWKINEKGEKLLEWFQS